MNTTKIIYRNGYNICVIFLMIFIFIPTTMSSALDFGPKTKIFIGTSVAAASLVGFLYCNSQHDFYENEFLANAENTVNHAEIFRKLKLFFGVAELSSLGFVFWEIFRNGSGKPR